VPREEAGSNVEYALCKANEIVYSYYPVAVCVWRPWAIAR